MTDDKQEDATPALSGEQVKRMVAGLDALFEAVARPYWEFDGKDPQPVWRAGDHGYVPEKAWDAVFALLPDWAADAYAISWNDPEFDTADAMGSRIAAAYNEGGMDALRQWADRLDEDGVTYTVRPEDTDVVSDLMEDPGPTARPAAPDAPGMGA